jgi:DNA-binding CsgD family transcriptional regulator
VSDHPDAGRRLSQRERDAAELLMRGLANREIAAGLGISERTVRFHVERIFAKLGVTNRTEAVSVLAAQARDAARHQLPRAPVLHGREADVAVLRAVAAGPEDPILAIEGLGGVGKTSLAVAFAHELVECYPNAQLVVDLQGSAAPLAPADAMRGVIHAFTPERPLPEGLAQLAGVYRSTLAGSRAVLVLDDARDAAQVEPLIPPHGCALIVTSRAGLSLAGVRAHALAPLSHEAACALLAERAPDAAGVASTLAELCGELPLALVLASCALTSRPELAPEDLAARLADARDRIEYIDRADPARGVGASLGASFSLLGAPLEASLRALAVFCGSLDREAAAALFAVDERTTDERIGELLRRHLLEWNGTRGARARFRLHDLVPLHRDFDRKGLRLSAEDG